MKRFLLASLIGMMISSLAFGVDIKSQIGREDINLGTGTFQRRTSTGGTIQLHKVDGSAIPDGTISSSALSGSGDNLTYLRGDGTWFQLPRYFSTDAFSDNTTLYGNDLIVKGPWVDVRAYGAVGDWDGSTGTDSTSAIQAAIDNCSAARGGTVFIHGRYKITSSHM